MRSFQTALSFAPLITIMFLPLWAPAKGADTETSQAITDPLEIDRAVIAFTGAGIGEVGGPQTGADRRLRLAACPTPLVTNWHGRAKSTVRVECQGANGWRIFIATRPQSRARQPARIVKRGDPVTVVVRGRGFSVQQSGEAMENGAIGDWIGIRTARRADPVRARIERPGLAIIPAQ